MYKPREFWIQNPYNEIANATKVSAYDQEVNPQITEEIRVIEYSAYEQLQRRFEEAVEVIRFYADEDGGPYAAGDYHTADGGEMALNFLRSLDKEK